MKWLSVAWNGWNFNIHLFVSCSVLLTSCNVFALHDFCLHSLSFSLTWNNQIMEIPLKSHYSSFCIFSIHWNFTWSNMNKPVLHVCADLSTDLSTLHMHQKSIFLLFFVNYSQTSNIPLICVSDFVRQLNESEIVTENQSIKTVCQLVVTLSISRLSLCSNKLLILKRQCPLTKSLFK